MCTFIEDLQTGLYLGYDPKTKAIVWGSEENAYCFNDTSIVLALLNVNGGTQYVGRPGDRQPK